MQSASAWTIKKKQKKGNNKKNLFCEKCYWDYLGFDIQFVSCIWKGIKYGLCSDLHVLQLRHATCWARITSQTLLHEENRYECGGFLEQAVPELTWVKRKREGQMDCNQINDAFTSEKLYTKVLRSQVPLRADFVNNLRGRLTIRFVWIYFLNLHGFYFLTFASRMKFNLTILSYLLYL